MVQVVEEIRQVLIEHITHLSKKYDEIYYDIEVLTPQLRRHNLHLLQYIAECEAKGISAGFNMPLFKQTTVHDNFRMHWNVKQERKKLVKIEASILQLLKALKLTNEI